MSLDALPAAPVSALVEAPDGCAIPVSVHGAAGPVVILVHGWSCSAAFWAHQVAGLADRCRIVTLDLPGHGTAPIARRAPWSMAGFGADVVAVADWLGADEVALVGHSMGGAVAIEAALALGPRCRLLAGVDTFTEAAFYLPRPKEEIAARKAVFAGDFAGTMRGMIDAITGDDTDAATRRFIAEAMAATDPDAALGVLEALLAWDIEAVWPRLEMPRVAINSALLARRNELIDLPRLEMVLMEGPGHFPMLEQPEAFNALLAEAIARHMR